MESREAGIERLYPKITGRMSARYYYLIQLRKQLERVIALYVRNSPHQLLAEIVVARGHAARDFGI